MSQSSPSDKFGESNREPTSDVDPYRENPYQAADSWVPRLPPEKPSQLTNGFWINVAVVTTLLAGGVALIEPYTFIGLLTLEIPVLIRVMAVHRHYQRSARSSFSAIGSYYFSWFLAGVMLSASAIAFLTGCTVALALVGGLQIGPGSGPGPVIPLASGGITALLTFVGLYVLTFRFRF